MDRNDDQPLCGLRWQQSIRLTELMWDVVCRYLLGTLSRAECRQELDALCARHGGLGEAALHRGGADSLQELMSGR